MDWRKVWKDKTRGGYEIVYTVWCFTRARWVGIIRNESLAHSSHTWKKSGRYWGNSDINMDDYDLIPTDPEMSDWDKRRYSFCEEMDSRDEEIAASIAWEQGRKDVLSNLHELTTEELLKDERVQRLVEAAEVVRLQSYGLRNCWAGMWVNCPKENCVRLGSFPNQKVSYAFGGNWLGDEQSCPECKLAQALAEWEVSDE